LPVVKQSFPLKISDERWQVMKMVRLYATCLRQALVSKPPDAQEAYFEDIEQQMSDLIDILHSRTSGLHTRYNRKIGNWTIPWHRMRWISDDFYSHWNSCESGCGSTVIAVPNDPLRYDSDRRMARSTQQLLLYREVTVPKDPSTSL